MFDIPPPPVPLLDPAVAYACAGGAAVGGLVCLLWGRRIHRLIAALAGGGAGILAAPALAAKLVDVDLVIVQVATVSILAVVGLIAAHAVWALLAAGLVAVPVVMALAGHYVPESLPAPFSPAGQTLEDWAAAWAPFAWDRLTMAWESDSAKLLLASAPPVAVVLVAGLLLPRLAAIVMSSVLGAFAFLGAGALAAARAKPSLWQRAWDNLAVTVGCVGALALVGLIGQYRSVLRSRPIQRPEPHEERKQADG